jgi:hypothetical protein
MKSMVTLLAVATVMVFAAKINTPSAQVTIPAQDWYVYKKGLILRVTWKKFSYLPGLTIFHSDSEVLISITTTNWGYTLCSISMKSTTTEGLEITYETGQICPSTVQTTSSSQHYNLESDPPMELKGNIGNYIRGFSMKHDTGVVSFWGDSAEKFDTEWE